jgi:hypothetical protein
VVSRPIPPQSGTELPDDHGLHPAGAFPSIVGGLCFLILGGALLASSVVALWRWIGGLPW